MQHHNDTIKEEVLSRITAQRVAPRSRWYFFARHAALWIPGILVTLIGSFAVAGMLFGAVHAGWNYRPYTHPTLVSFLKQAIPLLWLGAFILFGSLIVRSLRLTARGYRYATGVILTISFLASVVLGAALFALDMTMGPNRIIRFHSERMQRGIWLDPDNGRLAGMIAIAEDGAVTLVDPAGKVWNIDATELMGEALIEHGASVRMIGMADGSGAFIGCIAFPWEFGELPGPGRRPMGPRGPGRLPELQPFEDGARCHEIIERALGRRYERNPLPRP